MGENAEDVAQELRRLQRCMSDLVSVLTLPAVWSNSEPERILETFLDAVLKLVDVHFLYIQARITSRELPIEALRITGAEEVGDTCDHILGDLHRSLGEEPLDDPQVKRRIIDGVEVSLLPLQIGVERSLGFIVVGSQRRDFPHQTERLVLTVAANQLAVKLQQAHLMSEQKYIARELNERVAQRTAELASVNEELRKEIAERKEIERQLRDNEAFLLDAQQLSQTGGWKHDLISNLVSGTPEIEKIFAITPEDDRFSADFFYGRLHPEDREEERATYLHALSERRGFQSEFRILLPDGSVRYIHNIGRPQFNDAAEVVGYLGTVIDLTEQHKVRADLENAVSEIKKSELKLRRVIDTIPSLSWCSLPDGSNEFLSKGWHDFTGLSPEESHGWGWQIAFHPEDLPSLLVRWQELLSTGESGEIEARLRRLDGVYRWFLIRLAPFRDDTGTILRWYGTSTDIQDRKLAEQRLQAKEQYLSAIVNTIPTTVWSTDSNGDCDFCNKRWLDFTGLTIEEALGSGWIRVIHPDDRLALVEHWKTCLATGAPEDIEVRMRRFDGTYRWFWFRGEPWHDSNGNIIRWYGTNVDIEDRRQAEDELKRSEEKYRVVVETASDAVISIDERGVIILANHATKTVFGYEPKELVGKPLTVLMPESMRVSHLTGYQRYVETHERSLNWQGTELVALRANGEEFPVEVSFGEMTTYGKRIFTGFIRDISEKKRAEEELRSQSRNLKLIIDTIPALAWSTHPDGSVDFYNQHYLDYTGFSQDQAIGWGWKNTIHPDDLKHAVIHWQQVRASEQPGEGEHRLRRHDGTYRWFLYRASPLRDENGRLIKWYGILTDIEDRKRAEQELLRKEAFLAKAQRLSATGSFSWRVETDEITFSEEARRIFGFEPDDFVTLELIMSRVHPEDLPSLMERTEAARKSSVIQDYEIRLVMQDGSVKYLHTNSSETKGIGGLREYIGAIQDVTQRRLAQESLNRAQSELAHVSRVSSLSALTAAIAHEVKQPLSGIIMNSSTCLRMLSADPPNINGAMETVRRTIRDGNRASDVISRLRSLFSKKEVTAEPVDINEAAREVVALSLSELQSNRVILRREFTHGLPLVQGDRIQLQQVILNLLRNASDAVSCVENSSREVIMRTETDGEHVQLSVRDSGVGFDPDFADRLFESFFTTKQEGMGIGLSVSRSIIEAHRGRMWATANDGPGATFAFSIPCRHGNYQGKKQ